MSQIHWLKVRNGDLQQISGKVLAIDVYDVGYRPLAKYPQPCTVSAADVAYRGDWNQSQDQWNYFFVTDSGKIDRISGRSWSHCSPASAFVRSRQSLNDVSRHSSGSRFVGRYLQFHQGGAQRNSI